MEENATRQLESSGSAANTCKKTKPPKETLNPNNSQDTAMLIGIKSTNESRDATKK